MKTSVCMFGALLAIVCAAVFQVPRFSRKPRRRYALEEGRS